MQSEKRRSGHALHMTITSCVAVSTEMNDTVLTVARNLPNLRHVAHDQCSVPASSRLHYTNLRRFANVLRPLQQAFSVSVQLAATADWSLDLALVLDRHYSYLFSIQVYMPL